MDNSMIFKCAIRAIQPGYACFHSSRPMRRSFIGLFPRWLFPLSSVSLVIGEPDARSNTKYPVIHAVFAIDRFFGNLNLGLGLPENRKRPSIRGYPICSALIVQFVVAGAAARRLTSARYLPRLWGCKEIDGYIIRQGTFRHAGRKDTGNYTTKPTPHYTLVNLQLTTEKPQNKYPKRP
ncbi:uncharacterized protein BT62DRAFT_1010504 [Guyanagaster necrorhizus]|uniref:Uncharacterized protein n=1 Tax=Guyanagaster necrorhizus TaxID=856835 RepID=A0A9P8ANU9_9AGAR|nr:uncharacterized protein BT62DRAFT_1010504 [Guyanagaster necrorhizus MCA 3950]KAG7442249.1 hypothetical protein BT62DRAFT_1010504 [Guyanagaster necrorhizus MCA 3950]